MALIESLGGEVSECELPHAPHGISAYYVIAPAEASANLARFDGVRYGLRVDADDLTAMYEGTRAAGFGPEVKRRIMLGTYALSSGYYDAYYGRAQRVRTKIAEDFRAAFEDFDFIVTPTSPSVAFELGERTADPLAMYLRLLHGADAAGRDPGDLDPGRAGRAGRGRPALPVGFQIAGPAFSDRLLDAAHALEGAIGFRGNGRWRVEGCSLTEEETREAVQDALDALPPEIASRLTNVAVIIEDRHPSGRLLGLFDRRMDMQRITIYREHHTSAEDVKRTVWHEVGHYFGMNEQQVRGLGY